MPFNTPIQQSNNQQEHDWHNCQIRMVDDTELMECQMEVIECPWALPLGEYRFCKHPSANGDDREL